MKPRKQKERLFPHIGELVRSKREKTPFNQRDVSHILGWRASSGQFVSNIERGICSVPHEKIGELSQVLRCPVSELKSAIMADFELQLNKALEHQTGWQDPSTQN